MLDEILAQDYPKQETLKDGTKVSIRPLEADGPAVTAKAIAPSIDQRTG